MNGHSTYTSLPGIPYGNGYHLQSLTEAEFITVWKVRKILNEMLGTDFDKTFRYFLPMS
jgi:hypothetical protein